MFGLLKSDTITRKGAVNEAAIKKNRDRTKRPTPEKKKPDQSARGWPKGPGNSE
jgi:hypothetical protein